MEEAKENNQHDSKLNNKLKEECLELKNINYKNMLIKGSNLSNNTEKYNNNILDNYLEQELLLNKKEHWIKLDNPEKLSKIKIYCDKLVSKYDLNNSEIINMNEFFLNCINSKKISKIKDIDYDKSSGIIMNIPLVMFNNDTRLFYIKKSDKHVSTLKSIPSKKNKTKTNKEIKN